MAFGGESLAGILDGIIHGEPEAMARFNREVAPELERIILKCLRKSPAERFQSARELLVDLNALERTTAAVPGDAAARTFETGQVMTLLMTRGVFDSARQLLRPESIESIRSIQWAHHGTYILEGVEGPVEICETYAGQGEEGALEPPPTSTRARRQVVDEGEPVLGWRPAVGQIIPGTDWVLEEKLGEGGFGEVWLGQNTRLKDRHVFKFCFRADRIRALKREVTLFRLLKEKAGEQTGIVRLYDVYFDQAPFFIEEEYVQGRDWGQWAQTQGGLERVPMEAKLEVVAQVAWDANTGKSEPPLDIDRGTRALHFSSDGKRFVCGGVSQTATVWDYERREALQVLYGHSAEVRSVSFSPDNRRILTSSSDQTAKLWDAETGRELLSLEGHTGDVFGAACSPDGWMIATASFDGTIKLWRAATPQQVAGWHAEEEASRAAVMPE